MHFQGECADFSDVLDIYEEITPNIKLGGPTNFAPLIDKAVEIVKRKRKVYLYTFYVTLRVSFYFILVFHIPKLSGMFKLLFPQA